MAKPDPKKLYAVLARDLASLDLTTEKEATENASRYAANEPGMEFLVIEVVSIAFTPATNPQPQEESTTP